jgi:tRNA(adenine34) deaminase
LSLEGLDVEVLMREALAEAEAAGAAGEYPIGAVVAVRGEIVGRGRARHNEVHSQLAHAELAALQTGGEPLWLDFEEAVLVTTVEPCPLCLGAAVMADVPHIVFGVHDPVVESAVIVQEISYVRRHIQSYVGGVLEAESRALWDRFKPGWSRP